MTQRIFDMENEQDTADLFNLLPDTVARIEKMSGKQIMIHLHNCGWTADLPLKIKWGDKKSVTRPVDKSKWIGCLCWFWDDEEDNKAIGILHQIRKDWFYRLGECGYSNCHPVKREEIKFVED